jgi:hypothetical protein
VDIQSTDVCYADNTGKHFKRMIITNSLDQRFFDNEKKTGKEGGHEGKEGEEQKGKKIMKEPFE